ncbi:putative neutral zinc metallopeptidase [Kribbella orskensis]|uniref:Neutral zinc metallopeptidase n=1 Tax=Kribbella orskensis TaxID=2512216 RepID=A0ABY2BCB2_9ACTN|nr:MULTISPECIES: neutral zinc metallopeptidase [Kribbella]TCN32857.1 putative neutral zinc metallopeptidase [Kribbella sp. VKM Ac-2500]TCO13269.1 putative neutral zinc metallopeptidase [Kribbella orskensis]
MTGCLSVAWRPVLGRVSGETFVPPRVFAADDGDATACGSVGDEGDAFYCAASLGIYFDWEMFAAVDDGDRLDTEIDLMDMVAHEYGHHMQLLSGIDERYELRYDDTTGEAQLRLTRRMELQASCFAAAFLGANRRSLGLTGDRLEHLMSTIEVGDDPESGPADHGSAESNRYWGQAAFKSGSPRSCNTWSAPVERVK